MTELEFSEQLKQFRKAQRRAQQESVDQLAPAGGVRLVCLLFFMKKAAGGCLSSLWV